ncbi:DUF3943 domain-containing protein [Cystobacter ferrugineus]|uniref:DUF3943 domain-containing protein n=1 Tax=Cystobacter ferrugineus TaxID=83449 RepID=A0A1L9BDC8_9BACT|nr:DUF3943 domain-containing protein [Cystobacter ferrugineus]OJH40264.1 hypothetical protein BON30_14570 [Cystobacter ferrugineus]
MFALILVAVVTSQAPFNASTAEEVAASSDAGIPQDVGQSAGSVPALAPDGGTLPESDSPLVPPRVASSANAEAPFDTSASQKTAASYLIPSAEILALYGGIVAFNKVVFRDKEWSHVTPGSIRDNLDGPWVIDNDDFAINQIGHPYQGSVYFSAARSSGLSFWESFLYVAAGSLLWEVGGEAEPPSINDQITTTFAGTLFGEVLYRVWNDLIGPEGGKTSILRHIAAAPLSPVGSFNHYVFKRRARFVDSNLFYRAWIGSSYGGSIRDQTGARTELLGFGQQLSLGVGLTQGFPGTSGDIDYGPFDHYDLRFELSLPRTPYVGLFVRGLLLGTDFQPKPWAHGLIGVFGSYDYSTLPLLRVSTSAVGPGLAMNVALGAGVTLQGTVLLAPIFFGGAGAITATSGGRDFRAGGGGQNLFDLRLLLRDSGSINAGVRNYAIRGFPDAPGTELISYGWVGSELRVVGGHVIGVEVQWSTRAASDPTLGNLSHAGSLFRLYYGFVNDAFSGAANRPGGGLR